MAATDKFAADEAVETENPGALKPGAAPFGNFPHYSRFHPPEQRLRLLPPELLRQLFPPEGPERRPILGLDVGCNSGVSDAGGIGALGVKQLSPPRPPWFFWPGRGIKACPKWAFKV